MYRLTDDRSGESCTIKAGIKGNLTVLSKVDGKEVRRAIRHCPNQRSIFIDEQDDHALVKPIIFTNGYLHVPSDQPLTIEFLDAHPTNVVNGGIWFERVDEEQEAAESLEYEDLQTDLKNIVKQMAKKALTAKKNEDKDEAIHQLSAVVAVIEDNITAATSYGIESLRRVIYNKIEEDPYYFTDGNGNIVIFEDDDNMRKYITLRALNDGVISKTIDGRTMLWTKGKKSIFTAPMGVNLTEAFADFLASDDGMLVAKTIAERS